MTTNIKPSEKLLASQIIKYPYFYQNAHGLWNYYIDVNHDMKISALSKEEAIRNYEFYTIELNKWLKTNNIKEIAYYPETPGILQLNDINQLLTKYRRENGTKNPPTALIIGRWEREQLASIGPVNICEIPSPRHGRVKQAHDFYIPFEFFGLKVYTINVFSHLELLRS